MESKNERETFKKLFLYSLLISAPLTLLRAFFILSGEGGVKVNGHEFIGLTGFVIQILKKKGGKRFFYQMVGR